MNHNKKAWGITLLGLCLMTSIVSAFFFYQWQYFVPVSMEEQRALQVEADAPETAASAWISTYMKYYEGIMVPYAYRLDDFEIIQVTALDEPDFYEVEYLLHIATPNNQLVSTLDVTYESDDVYRAKTILCMNQIRDTYYVSKIMNHAQYLYAYDSEPYTYQQPIYAMVDEDKTYLLQNEVLEVTYDHGNTFIKVPIAYEDITRNPFHAYTQNLLQEGSYIVDNDYTAFLYTSENRDLCIIYSLDQGITWKESVIGQNLSQRVKFIAKTDQSVHVFTATDKAMSSEGHALYRSDDFETFQLVENYHDPEARLMTYATFINDEVSYVAYTQIHTMDDKNDDVARCYRSENGGVDYQEIILPKHEVTVKNFTYAPFVQVEKIYQRKDKVSILVGQGDNGDYGTKEGLYQALYESVDGINFTFVKEVINAPVLAG